MWKWKLICWFVNLISRERGAKRRRFQSLRERVTRELDKNRDVWETFTRYPKSPQLTAPRWNTESDLAVLVQGPVREKDQLTLETLRLYRTAFGDRPVVFSTWNDAPVDVLRAAQRLGVTVVTGSPPDYGGPAHLNHQIESTRRGLEAISEMGVRYALKTRSDTRLHAPHVGDYLAGLLKAFPIREPQHQRERIAVLDLVTRLYIPYHVSDMLMFGRCDDLLDYWSLPICKPGLELKTTDRYDVLLQNPIPEVILCSQYLKKLNVPIHGSLEHWWEILAERFLVIDRAAIGFFWPKYNYDEGHTLGACDDVTNMALCSFRDWVNLSILNKKPDTSVDRLKQCKIKDPISPLCPKESGSVQMSVRTLQPSCDRRAA